MESLHGSWVAKNRGVWYCDTCCDPLMFPLQGGVPTLRDLSLISVPNWYLLGLQLGVSGDKLDMIEKNYSRNNHMCKVKMFGTWLRLDTSATYGKLTRALIAVGNRTIAETVCITKGMEDRIVLYIIYI